MAPLKFGGTDGRPTIEDGLLPRCTVRIYVGGVLRGTGFFVAPGTVVTCEHVIQSQPVAPGDPVAIKVVDAEAQDHDVLEPKVWPDADLAILKLAKSSDHPCVLFSPSLRSRDPVHTFGYTLKHDDGIPTDFTAEGETGTNVAPKKAKLAAGQAVEGMSGSPLYNVRTEAVYGVLQISRDQLQALGAYAISIKVLLDLEPSLQGLNDRYHAANRTWLDLMTPARRIQVRPADAKEPKEPRIKLVLTVSQGKKGWQVAAKVFPGGDGPKPVPVDLNPVRVQVARLFGDWASRGRVLEGDQIRLLGEILYRALFQGDVLERFTRLLDERLEKPVSVAICFAEGMAPDLVQLPWEHVYIPASETTTEVYLATDGSLRFMRSLPTEPDERFRKSTQRGLSVLVVRVGPPSSAAEWKVVDTETAALIVRDTRQLETADLRVNEIENPKPSELADELRTGDYDVMHYVGFGRYRDGVDELVLRSEAGNLDYAGIGLLSEGVRAMVEGERANRPSLVVLQLTGEYEPVRADFALLAPALLKERISAVVAYQYPVRLMMAMYFNETLYQELAKGSTLAAAVQRARERVRTQGTSRAFVSPALFVRQPGDLRLAAPPTEAGATASRAVSASYG